MMRLISFVFFSFLTLPIFARQISTMYPTYTQLIERDGYTVLYDGRNKIPIWVHEHLTKESLQKNSNKKYKFTSDQLIYLLHRSFNSDYTGSGYDRGHMAPRANHRSSTDAIRDTYFYSNACPQNHPFNGGIWASLEQYCRDLVIEDHYDAVDVITGPLFLSKNLNGKKWVSYEVIGESEVAVPTHFFKVIYIHESNNIRTESYIMPVVGYGSWDLEEYEEPLDKIEKVSGLIFPKNFN